MAIINQNGEILLDKYIESNFIIEIGMIITNNNLCLIKNNKELEEIKLSIFDSNKLCKIKSKVLKEIIKFEDINAIKNLNKKILMNHKNYFKLFIFNNELCLETVIYGYFFVSKSIYNRNYYATFSENGWIFIDSKTYKICKYGIPYLLDSNNNYLFLCLYRYNESSRDIQLCLYDRKYIFILYLNKLFIYELPNHINYQI